MPKDYYSTLGVDRSASADDVKRASKLALGTLTLGVAGHTLNAQKHAPTHD